MPVIAGFMVPHPPMIVPAVGRGSEAQVKETTAAYEKVAEEMAEIEPDTIVISSPHSIMYTDYFHISPGKGARGDFGDFGAPEVAFEETYDEELVQEICREAEECHFRAGTLGERDKALDHGTMVPLYFIRQKYKCGKIVRLGLSGLPLTEHYALGMMISNAVNKLGRKAVYVASGDLSHKLKDYGPYGFAEEGPVYDERIMNVMRRGAFGELFDFDETFCEKAAECGHRSFVIMAGTMDGKSIKAEQYSHQDVTGVGYGVCSFYAGEQDESRHFLENSRKYLLFACFRTVSGGPKKPVSRYFCKKQGQVSAQKHLFRCDCRTRPREQADTFPNVKKSVCFCLDFAAEISGNERKKQTLIIGFI